MNLCDRTLTSDTLSGHQSRHWSQQKALTVKPSEAEQIGFSKLSSSQSSIHLVMLEESSQQLRAWLLDVDQPNAILLEHIGNLELESVATLTMAELKQLLSKIEYFEFDMPDSSSYQIYRQWSERTIQEIQKRQLFHQLIQATLIQSLQELWDLNPRLYQRDRLDLDLDSLLQKVLDQTEEQVKPEILACCTTLNESYETYKLIRLARINCRVQEAKWNLKRSKIACGVFPILGLMVTATFLLLAMDWMEALSLTLFVVAPLMFWIIHSMQKEIKHRAKQDLQQRKQIFHAEQQRLNLQEATVSDRWALLFYSSFDTPAACELLPC